MTWDAIVIGSGFGGAMAAHALVHAGQRVLMLERGAWVSRSPENWGAQGAGLVTPHYSMESPYRVRTGDRSFLAGSWHCVGGQSVFYGGASFRFRMRDFEDEPAITGDSDAAWPFRYADLEPYYARAERLLGVAGEHGTDPTEPSRSSPYPQEPPPLSGPSRVIADAARRLGLSPFRIPLAINYSSSTERRGCLRCGTCDGYACAAEAKNDVATGILPALMRRGMVLCANTVCVRLLRRGSRIIGAECVDRITGQRRREMARCVVLAAGALATPHLLLASNLAMSGPAPHAVGRYLTRHRNAVVFGLFRRPPNPDGVFDKQIAIHDFYFGAAGSEAPAGPLGSIQQMTPPLGMVRAYVPRAVRDPAALLVSYTSGLLVMAEDQPQRRNGVTIDTSAVDRSGLPLLHVQHCYSTRDEAAASALAVHARGILREAGALLTWVHPLDTFTHALGSVRMGPDERTAPLDGDGRYRGLDSLYVADGSALPRSAGVNPSLTIAANALRIGSEIARSLAPAQRYSSRALPIAEALPLERVR